MITLLLSLVLVLLSILPILCKYYWKRLDQKTGIPGPPLIPIIGNALDVSTAASKGKAFRVFESYERKYGSTFRVRLFNITFILSSDVRIMELLNTPNVGKAEPYRFLEPWLGKSLVITDGDRWSQLRRIATPAFHFQILEDFIPIFEEQTEILIKRLREAGANESIFNVVPYLGGFTMDVILETAMGIKIGAQTGKENEFLFAINDIINLISQRSLNPLYYPNIIWNLTAKGRRHNECLRIIHTFIDNVINERRQYLLKLEDKTQARKRRMALLDTLLHSTMNGKPLSNEDIQGEVATFAFAGYDTTKATLCGLLYQLAKHPEIQQRLYQEINEQITEMKTNHLDIRTINNLTLLDLCIKESLRLLPPVPIVGKQNKEEIHVDGMTIPADSVIFVMIMANHLNPKYFPDPDKFYPERFAKEMSNEERHPFLYAPFSVGLRNCVGQKFALLNIKTTIIKLLTSFRIELESEDYVMEVKSLGVLEPANGLPLKFIPRD